MATMSISKVKSTLSIAARLLFAVILILPFTSSLASASDNPKVVEAMATLKAETEKLGMPKLDGDSLFFGSEKMNDNFVLVDAVKAKHGATATVFAKKGTNYVRITTNVMKDDKRAVGSVLDTSGPAYASINEGKPFYGLVDILGKMYDTGYEPIKNEAGEVIGILYVGFLAE